MFYTETFINTCIYMPRVAWSAVLLKYFIYQNNLIHNIGWHLNSCDKGSVPSVFNEEFQVLLLTKLLCLTVIPLHTTERVSVVF